MLKGTMFEMFYSASMISCQQIVETVDVFVFPHCIMLPEITKIGSQPTMLLQKYKGNLLMLFEFSMVFKRVFRSFPHSHISIMSPLYLPSHSASPQSCSLNRAKRPVSSPGTVRGGASVAKAFWAHFEL